MKQSAEQILASYVDALRPLIYIHHFDFHVIDQLLQEIGHGVQIEEYSHALGQVDFHTKAPMTACTLAQFLDRTREDGYEQPTFLVLKDIHGQLREPDIIAYLERIAEDNMYREGYQCTVFVVSSELVIPPELENYITVFDIPAPSKEEISEILQRFVKEMDIHPAERVLDEMALSFKGLNEFQIQQILNLAYQDGGCLDREDKALILREKEQFIKKSGLLELVNFKETIEDIGGLGNLKNWLFNKSRIFQELEKAVRFGVDIPKGILIIGMPGCGKSLAAKATASLFQIPLVRLDVGRLFGKYVGDSESNMRKALKLAEDISPCVLWIDEVEKAFAGVGGAGGGSDVTTRLFGQFLTWMQEKDNTVFIVATANDVSKMPLEFLRKGRFDELFFVDLPNEEERKQIIEIHLKKRNKWDRNIDSIQLMKVTNGFNGADLESVVKEAIEMSYLKGEETVTTEELLQIIHDTKSISQIMKEKIQDIRKSLEKIDIQRATSKEGEPAIQRIEKSYSVLTQEKSPSEDPQKEASEVRVIKKQNPTSPQIEKKRQITETIVPRSIGGYTENEIRDILEQHLHEFSEEYLHEASDLNYRNDIWRVLNKENRGEISFIEEEARLIGKIGHGKFVSNIKERYYSPWYKEKWGVTSILNMIGVNCLQNDCDRIRISLQKGKIILIPSDTWDYRVILTKLTK